MSFFRLTRPVLGMFNAERPIASPSGRCARVVPAGPGVDHPVLAIRVIGLDFPNPVGLAAGFDKNAEVIDAMLKQRLRLCRSGVADA